MRSGTEYCNNIIFIYIIYHVVITAGHALPTVDDVNDLRERMESQQHLREPAGMGGGPPGVSAPFP